MEGSIALQERTPLSDRERLQEYFDIAIPKLLELIEQKQITHILLLEKTARLFKHPLIRLFWKLWMDVKVWSFAPDYFPVNPAYKPSYSGRIRQEDTMKTIGRREYEKKLRFLPNPESSMYQILLLDDFLENGSAMKKSQSWLQKLWFCSDSIHTCSFDGTNLWKLDIDMLHPNFTLADIICDFSIRAANFYWKSNIFQWDSYRFSVYYATKNKKHPDRFRQVVQDVTSIILNTIR